MDVVQDAERVEKQLLFVGHGLGGGKGRRGRSDEAQDLLAGQAEPVQLGQAPHQLFYVGRR